MWEFIRWIWLEKTLCVGPQSGNWTVISWERWEPGLCRHSNFISNAFLDNHYAREFWWYLKEISKLHFIQRAGNLRKQWINLLNVCLAHLSMQEGVSICVMHVTWRKANGILQELNAVPLNCWSAPFLKTGESRFLLVLLLISLNLWMFRFRYFFPFLCLILKFSCMYTVKRNLFSSAHPTTLIQPYLPSITLPTSHLLKNNPLSTMLSVCMEYGPALGTWRP